MENIRSNPFYDDELVKECIKRIMPNSKELEQEKKVEVQEETVDDLYEITDFHIGKKKFKSLWRKRFQRRKI